MYHAFYRRCLSESVLKLTPALQLIKGLQVSEMSRQTAQVSHNGIDKE